MKQEDLVAAVGITGNEFVVVSHWYQSTHKHICHWMATRQFALNVHAENRKIPFRVNASEIFVPQQLA